MAKGICCDDFVKVLSKTKACLIFLNRLKLSLIIPVLTGLVILSFQEMCVQLKNLAKVSIFLNSIYFKQILNFLIVKELKSIQGTINETHIGSHKGQALGRNLSHKTELPKQE